MSARCEPGLYPRMAMSTINGMKPNLASRLTFLPYLVANIGYCIRFSMAPDPDHRFFGQMVISVMIERASIPHDRSLEPRHAREEAHLIFSRADDLTNSILGHKTTSQHEKSSTR